MKTTSYEISKKLKEIGFEAETDFYWYCYDTGQEMRHIADADGKGNVKAYDLETILNAFPAHIKTKKRKTYHFVLFKDVLGYYGTSCDLNYNNFQLYDNIFELYSHDKSLTNTAGRLLIELFEAGIINLNK